MPLADSDDTLLMLSVSPTPVSHSDPSMADEAWLVMLDTPSLGGVIAAAAVAALYMTDPNRPIRDYAAAGLAAVLGPILKAIDPKEKQFGIGSDEFEANKNVAE